MAHRLYVSACCYPGRDLARMNRGPRTKQHCELADDGSGDAQGENVLPPAEQKQTQTPVEAHQEQGYVGVRAFPW